MLPLDLFNRIKKATDQVSKIEVSTEMEGGSRARFDDNIGGNITDDLRVMLDNNKEFRQWYSALARREANETNINTKRELALKLMYPFKYYSETLRGKAKSDWEGSLGTYRDSDMQQNRVRDGDEDDSTPFDGKGQATDQYMSDRQKYETQTKGTTNAFRYTLDSVGSKGTVTADTDPADTLMTSQFLTKLIREVNKHRDPKVMTLLMAQMLRWGINIPTYVNRRDVPKVWWQMVSFANKNGGIGKSTINLRSFLDNFGLKRYGTDSPQLRELRQIMMRVTDSKTVDELYRTLLSPQASKFETGDAGKAKDYFAIDVYAKRQQEFKDEEAAMKANGGKPTISESYREIHPGFIKFVASISESYQAA